MPPTKTKPRTALKKRVMGRVRTEAAQEEPEADPRTIRGRLVICREKAGLIPAEAARRIGITSQSLGQLEIGKSKQPAADTLLDMRDKVGYDPDYVMRGIGVPLIPNFEELAQEMALIVLYRELYPEIRKNLIRIAQGLRRAQGGKSFSDPFNIDPPEGDDD